MGIFITFGYADTTDSQLRIYVTFGYEDTLYFQFRDFRLFFVGLGVFGATDKRHWVQQGSLGSSPERLRHLAKGRQPILTISASVGGVSGSARRSPLFPFS